MSNALEAAVLEHKFLQYPMICPSIRSFYIDPNRYDAPANTIFTTKMPRRLFLGLVSSEAYNGSFGTSPFCFKPYGITNIHVDACGMSFPGRPMNMDFANNKFIESYVMLQESLGHIRNNHSCNSISREMFASKGYTIFGFELSAVAKDSSLFDLNKITNVSIRLNFSELVPAGGLYCVVYAEFDAVIMRIREPKTTALIFSSGKIVCTGAKSEESSRLAARKYARIVQKIGYNTRFSEFEVQNVVASFDAGFGIQLDALSIVHSRFCTYEPEIFPGLVYRTVEPRATLLVFLSGKVVITGTKTSKDIEDVFEQISPILREFKK
ncbi:hypothetical protein B9Z55_011165 [Caenorhabditis nigoni]|uniref:TATA-box-binding protein n=2 Tax=Caenorhabditis nigoni TaxID=1611254 RepID=A0A2G5UIX8_9PELO|nr:hypothetical protein B9Z55_011165 [Caenorhabditis nigoni]